MKKTACILLLIILAFNWIGYRCLLSVFEHKANIALELSIDNTEYDEANLVELRVPLNIAYISESPEFERYYGELEINGIHYKYVKRKIEKGELVLLCIPNEEKMKFQDSRISFFKLVNDLDHSSQTKESKSFSSFASFTKEYKQENNFWIVESLFARKIKYLPVHEKYSSAGYLSIPLQPPRI